MSHFYKQCGLPVAAGVWHNFWEHFKFNRANAITKVEKLPLNLSITSEPNPNFSAKNAPSNSQFLESMSLFDKLMLLIICRKQK